MIKFCGHLFEKIKLYNGKHTKEEFDIIFEKLSFEQKNLMHITL